MNAWSIFDAKGREFRMPEGVEIKPICYKAPDYREEMRREYLEHGACFCATLGHMAPCSWCTDITAEEFEIRQRGGSLWEYWEKIDENGGLPE